MPPVMKATLRRSLSRQQSAPWKLLLAGCRRRHVYDVRRRRRRRHRRPQMQRQRKRQRKRRRNRQWKRKQKRKCKRRCERREKRSWNVAGHPAGSSSSVVGCGRGTSAWSRSGSGSSAPPTGSELGDSDSEGLVGCSEVVWAGHFRSLLATKAAGSAESATIAAATASDKAGFSAAVTRAAVTACGDGISVETDQTLRLRPAVRRRARAVLATVHQGRQLSGETHTIFLNLSFVSTGDYFRRRRRPPEVPHLPGWRCPPTEDYLRPPAASRSYIP